MDSSARILLTCYTQTQNDMYHRATFMQRHVKWSTRLQISAKWIPPREFCLHAIHKHKMICIIARHYAEACKWSTRLQIICKNGFLSANYV
eukprot:GEMP01135205.1.p1 GENE.GEMP01135205.1~~GEMP01135205.1.p1  ORF type:complete len:107 (-),score=2.37 GEMP01135205.1:178-450(-)